MKESSIEDIAYLIHTAKENNLPKPIVFLGAGASVTGNIPLVGEIIRDIQEKYPKNPKIKKLPKSERAYAKLMECLLPTERNKLLKQYIDRAKINVTHIYLAHLITQGYVDYVLTVNFDNLMLRALALFNYFPPTYDLAVLKALTTTTLHEKSVVYLHGQHHGLWLLNTKEEMRSIDQIVPSILNKIANERPWIVIGYSGNDPIFDHIIDLGRFDNGMFWVCYKDRLPEDKVCANLLNKANTNASILKGYDSDTFMLTLNNELGLGEPFILDKPFSFLNIAVDNIVENYEKKEYTSVKERLKITKRQIQLAIQQFEEGKLIQTEEVGAEIISDQLKKEIINKIIQKDFEGLAAFRELVSKSDDIDLKNQLADLYYGASLALIDESKGKEKEEAVPLLNEVIEQLEISISLNPNLDKSFNDLSFALIELSVHQSDLVEKEKLLNEAIQQCQNAIKLKEDNEIGYYNWGVALDDLAKNKEGEDRKKLLLDSVDCYKKSIEHKEDYDLAYCNLGVAYVQLTKLSPAEEIENLYELSKEQFEKAVTYNPDYVDYYANLSSIILNLAKYKNEGKEEMILEAIDYCNQAYGLDPNNIEIHSCLGRSYFDLGDIKKGEEKKTCFKKSIDACRKAIALDEKHYSSYHTLGNSLQALAKIETKINAIRLLKDSIQQYEQAISLNSEESALREDCSAGYIELAKRQTGVEQVNLFFKCEEHVLKAKELSGRVYNLSCFYALRGMKKEALEELEVALKNKEIETSYVIKDPDWANFYEDSDFQNLLKQWE